MPNSAKGGVFFEPSFILQTFTAQPIQPTTHTNNTWRLTGWLRASCGRDMRAVRLCHTTSQWRGTTAELYCCYQGSCSNVRTPRSAVRTLFVPTPALILLLAQCSNTCQLCCWHTVRTHVRLRAEASYENRAILSRFERFLTSSW